MAIATFDGAAIFGIGAYSRVNQNPARLQFNTYNGINGREMLALGSTGNRAEIDFLATAPDEPTLAAYELTFRNLQGNATVGIFSDTLGHSWPNAVLVEFGPTDSVDPSLAPTVDDPRWISRTYRAVFEIG